MNIKVFIAGAGGIGKAAGLILTESKLHQISILFGDISEAALQQAKLFVEEGATQPAQVDTFLMSKSGDDEALKEVLTAYDVILDCLPGSQAPRLAQIALDTACHYANLTEYVAETNAIMDMAKNAQTGFTLQTGLAPGFINILACKLYNDFVASYGVEQLDEMAMKVGALSDHAPAPHFYAFTWSPIGVATEYIKDAVVVKDYKTQEVASLSGMSKIIINGQMYEDNYTSGGAADLPAYFNGKVKDLHYKTLRHPGHYSWVKDTISNLPQDQKIQSLEKIMLEEIGHVEDDNVVVYASVQGMDKSGVVRRLEKAYKIEPIKVGKHTLRAIQTTTAAPLCETAIMMVENKAKGVILQSMIDPDKFLNGSFVKEIYGDY